MVDRSPFSGTPQGDRPARRFSRELVRDSAPLPGAPPELGRVVARIETSTQAIHTLVAWLLRALWRAPAPARTVLLEALALALAHPEAAPVQAYLTWLGIELRRDGMIRAYLASVRVQWSPDALERRLERALRASGGRAADTPIGACTIHGCSSPALSVLMLATTLRAQQLLA